MSKTFAAIVLALLGLGMASGAGAQTLRGMVSFGVNSDLNHDQFPEIGGGVLLDVARGWASIGGQGDLFMSNGYFGGRAQVFGQANIVRRGPVRPFAMGGTGFGENDGPMVGAGIEISPAARRVAFRFTAQDFITKVGGFDCARLGYEQAYCDSNFNGGRAYTAHQTLIQFGIVWR